MRAPRVGGPGWLTAALLAFAVPVAAQELSEGRWKAEARMGPEAMTLLLDVERRDGELGGRISVPAERVLGLRLERFACGQGQVSFRIPHADHPMDFAGHLGAERRIEGELAMGEHAVPLVFVHAGATPEPPYRELEVSFAGEGRTVHGSLLLPPGDGPHPALALFHPTSTPRRDDLRFLADLAARAGLAALIYDRREVPADVAALTRADFLAVVADAEAAVRFLRSRDDIDGPRVGVGGLSQGAWIAAIVATRVPEVGFVVALSAPGVPLHEIDLYQSTRRLEAAGVQGRELAEARELLIELFAASRGEGGEDGDRDALARRLEQARREPWAAPLALPDEVPPGGASATLLRWSAQDLDPLLFFERLRMPVFLAFGERDERLPAEACATRIAASLERAGNSAVTLHRYPNADHALLPAPEFEQDLAGWLRERAGG
jgi:dienelactone hydrolase